MNKVQTNVAIYTHHRRSKVSEVMPTMPKELPAIVLNLQCFFTGFASLKTSTQTIKHPYSYLPDLATTLQTQDLLPWLAPCGGSKAPVAVRTSSHALCSSSHHCPGNHSMHPHSGLLCRKNTDRTTFIRTSSSSSDYHFSRRKESYKGH